MIVLLLLVAACGPKLKQLPASQKFSNKDIIGYSNDKRLEEASGLAVSLKNPGHLWTHNDSGGDPALYLINEKGELVMTAWLNSENIDWEDVAIARDGSGYIYIGDIGDNRAERKMLSIYRIVEPEMDTLSKVRVSFERMIIKYEEGPRDSEALMIDPFTKELILLTKREDNIMVYSFPFSPDASLDISSRGKIPLTQITAGDINLNGDVLLKSYNQIFYLENKNKTPIVKLLLNGNLLLIDYEIEKQGEALTWSMDGNSFFVLSEWNDNLPQPLYRYY